MLFDTVCLCYGIVTFHLSTGMNVIIFRERIKGHIRMKKFDKGLLIF